MRVHLSALSLGLLCSCAKTNPPVAAPEPAEPETLAPVSVSEQEDLPNTAAIQAAVFGSNAKIKACYDSALAEDASLAGKVVAEVDIGVDGSVSRVTIIENQVGHDKMESCITRVLSAMTTSPLTGSLPETVVLPYDFSL